MKMFSFLFKFIFHLEFAWLLFCHHYDNLDGTTLWLKLIDSRPCAILLLIYTSCLNVTPVCQLNPTNCFLKLLYDMLHTEKRSSAVQMWRIKRARNTSRSAANSSHIHPYLFVRCIRDPGCVCRSNVCPILALMPNGFQVSDRGWGMAHVIAWRENRW